MSTLKGSQQKIPIEARIFEVLTSVFPEFKCSITDIKFPKPDFVYGFYCFILEQLRFDVPKLLQGPLGNQLKGESHPELLVETLQLSNLSRALRTLLLNLQNGDELEFGLNDLVDPTVSRNSVFMFNLLNFFNYTDAKMHEYVDKLAIIGTRKAEMKHKLEAREKLSREFNHRAIVKAKSLDYDKMFKLKKAELDELQKESKSLEQLSEKTKMKVDDVKRRNERVQSDLSKLQILLRKLEAQKVQSPDAAKSNHKHLQEKLEEIMQKLQEDQKSLAAKKEALKLFETVEKNLDIRSALLQDLVNEAKIAKESEKQFVDLRAKLQSELSSSETLQAGLNDIKKELTHQSAQLTNLQLQWEKNKSSMKESIRHLAEENKSLELKQSKEMTHAVESIEQLQGEVNDLIEENKAFNEYCEKLYAELMHKEQSFVDDKNAKLDAQIAELELRKSSRAN